MQILSRGTEYLLFGSDREESGKPVHIQFCHKNSMGQFVNGMTSEEMMQMMIDRQQHLVEKDTCTENIQTLLYLKQAADCMNQRNLNKMKKKKNESTGNGVSVQAKGPTG